MKAFLKPWREHIVSAESAKQHCFREVGHGDSRAVMCAILGGDDVSSLQNNGHNEAKTEYVGAPPAGYVACVTHPLRDGGSITIHDVDPSRCAPHVSGAREMCERVQTAETCARIVIPHVREFDVCATDEGGVVATPGGGQCAGASTLASFQCRRVPRTDLKVEGEEDIMRCLRDRVHLGGDVTLDASGTCSDNKVGDVRDVCTRMLL